MANEQNNNSQRGFGSMDPNRQREIASEGGRASHASGNAHEFTSEEAKKAGSMSHGGQHQAQGGNQAQQGGNSAQPGGSSQAGNQGQQTGGSTRGGTPEQHAAAGRQSHKNT